MQTRIRRLFPLVLLALLLLAAIFYFTRRPKETPSSTPAPSATTSVSAQARPKNSPSSAPAPRPFAHSIRVIQASAAADPTLPHGSFEGRIISWATGQGIAGASITFAHQGESQSINTGEGGSFRFLPREDGTYTIVLISANEYLPFAPSPDESPLVFTARTGESIRGLTIYLTPAIQYLGVVQTKAGQPIAGARIQLVGDDGNALILSPLPDHFESDSKGEFRFSAPDDALLEARHASYEMVRARVDLGVQSSRRILLRMKEKSEIPSETIRGKVVDEKNAPILGAHISARPIEPSPPKAELTSYPVALSDENGAFTLSDTEPGKSYEIVASFQQLAIHRRKPVVSGTENLLIQLIGGASIEGTVRDKQNGAPLSAFTISLWTADGPLSRIPYRSAAFFDAQGHYRVDGLAPGDYALFAAANDYAPSAEYLFSIRDPKASPPPIDIGLSRGGKISGYVLDEETKAALEGARISLEGRLSASPSGALLSASAATNSKGYFELGGLSSSLCSMTIVAADHNTRIVSGILVPEGGSAGPLTVELSKTKEGEEPRIELTGIGAVLSAKDDVLVLGDVVPGGGAAEAGLMPGDTLLQIDGQSVVELGFEQSIQRIRGPEGSQVALVVRKGGTGEPVLIQVTRRRIKR